MPILPCPPAIEITLRRSARARRFSLRVSQLDGRVTLSVPQRAQDSEAMDFARSHEAWLRAALARRPAASAVALGQQIPVEGSLLTLAQATGRSCRIEGEQLLIPGDPAQTALRAAAWLKALARDRLAAACDHYAALLDRRVTRITLRDTRSRWGSCAQDGALMFSWRLILAPPSVLTYVAAHEVAHMVEMNHSDAYWAVVSRLYPQWQTQRKWLHTRGKDLHAYRF